MKLSLTVLGVILLSACSQKKEIFTQKENNDVFTDSIISSVVKENKQIKVDSLIQIDYLAYSFKYLNKDFKILIDNNSFNKSLKENHYIEERIKNYSDSLGVVLMYELNDWDATRIAKQQITFSWKRLGYYLHRSDRDLKNLNIKYEYKHPYLMFRHFKSNDEESEFKKAEINRIKNILVTDFKQDYNMITKLSNEEILNKSFELNPEIIRMRNEAAKEHQKLHQH
ncbi:hypothetical protein VUJ46_01070 [Chryseobacterium sp. MYb264]|uniref:hypothetical protein n=1 Tax=Chryseobacterium sp. MYb264 TaxID=2745153 RepID=UPI002E12EE59|nr:hypothetical protein VUJ46_01070 [Chryseobacterium sp. MYb264]